MSRTYSRRTCRCGRELSANGAAWHSHMMGHVRRGEAKLIPPANLFSYLNYEFRWLKEPAKPLPVNPVLNPRGYNP